MNIKKRIISVMLIVVLSIGSVMPVIATSVEDAQKKADELKKEKEKADLEKTSLANQLNTIIKEMQAAQAAMIRKEEEIATAEEELLIAKIEEDNQYQSMKKRIKFMYENGNAEFIELLMTSKSLTDFLNKAEYVNQISEYDREMLVEFQKIVKSVQEKEVALKAEYKQLEVLQASLSEKEASVQSLLTSKNVEIANLEKEIGDNAAVLNKLIADAAAAERRRVEASQGGSGGGGSAPSGPTSPNSGVGSGAYAHPCPGFKYKSSYFGEVRQGIGDPRPHSGDDYAAPAGTPIYATAAGRVVIAGYSNSAGNWVVINHGNGMISKYMHASSLNVSAGQNVVKGQHIAGVGTTGQSTGNHLHFQVEMNGTPVRPPQF